MKIILSITLAAILGLGLATSAFATTAPRLSYEDLFAKAQSEITKQMELPSRFTTGHHNAKGLLNDSKAAHEAGDEDKARKLAKKALRRAQTAQNYAAMERRQETMR
jgi:hypothetical protein